MRNSSEVLSGVEAMVMEVHRRNGGSLEALDTSLRLMDPALRLDSLDLAEIMALVEREYGASPFNSTPPPSTWADVVRAVAQA